MSSGFVASLRSARLYRRVVKTRFPFRFGKSSMTQMPVVTLRVEWEAADGTLFEGVSASGIPPLWFDKRDGITAEDNERDLFTSVLAARDAYLTAGQGTAWDLHHAVTEPVKAALVTTGQAPLAAGFGPAMLEAALVDGICRHLGRPFGDALRDGTLGVPAAVLAALPAASLDFVSLRHTVGLADALTADDLPVPYGDGLPETLEQVVAVYKPRYFKVKMNGDARETLPRLLRIAALLDASEDLARTGYSVTLDGNEQFTDMAAFADFLDQVRAEPALAAFLDKVLWIEQPVRRDTSLDPAAASALARVSAWRPVILDESDGEGDALERGLALGYGGVSSKTCKGLFRSISHAARLHREMNTAERAGLPPLILSCEDLTTVPVHPVQQDLCLAAALGLTHAERNGHHYILPSSFLSAAECRDALHEAPSFYEASGPGGALRVRIADGGFDLSEIISAHGFGSAQTPDWSALAEWSLHK
jgi:hypothetical protein